MIRRIIWWWHWKKHACPSQDEMFYLLPHVHQICTRRILKAALDYAMGYSLDEIAETMVCTRERIRQMICKAHRQARHVARNS